jgi:hypothetical protein
VQDIPAGTYLPAGTLKIIGNVATLMTGFLLTLLAVIAAGGLAFVTAGTSRTQRVRIRDQVESESAPSGFRGPVDVE